MVMIVIMSTGTVFAASDDRVFILPEDDGTGYPVTGITDSYSNDDEVIKVIVPENILRLGERAFWGCSNLNQIKLHDRIQAFEGTAFFENQNNWSDNTLILDYLLLSVNKEYTGAFFVPDGIRTIADSAFRYSKLTELITSDSLKHIGYNAFWIVKSLIQ